MFFINIVYGDDKIFVPRYEKRKAYVIAYDAETLKQLYVTSKFTGGSQAESHTIYNDGCIYLASWGEGAEFACFKTKDIDIDNNLEIINPLWIHKVSEKECFNANMGPTFINDICIYATGGHMKNGLSSTLYSVNKKTGNIIDTLVLPKGETVSSKITYYEKNNRIYIAANSNVGAVIRSYEINADGSIDDDNMKAYISNVKYGGTQSTPIIYNDRLYIGGGGKTMGSNEPFHVIDANTMNEIYRIDDLLSKGSAALTTAYATKSNNETVYIYMLPYAPKSKSPGVYSESYLYIIKDSIGQTKPSYKKMGIGSPEYCSQSIAIDKNGNMLFYNDAKSLYCYGNKSDTKIGIKEIIKDIERLPNEDEYKYYNKTEVLRIKERLDNIKNANISDKLVKKLNSIINLVNKDSNNTQKCISEDVNESLDGELKDSDSINNVINISEQLDNKNSKKKEIISSLGESIKKKDPVIDELKKKEILTAIDKIKNIDEICTNSKEDILYALSLYITLDDTQQKDIEDIKILEEASKRIENLECNINEFKAILDKLYDINTNNLSSVEDVNNLILTIDDIDEKLNELLQSFGEYDDKVIENHYKESSVVFLENSVITYLIDSYDILSKDVVENKLLLNKMVLYYEDFSEEDKAVWNHDNNIIKIKNILKDNNMLLENTDKLKSNNEENVKVFEETNNKKSVNYIAPIVLVLICGLVFIAFKIKKTKLD